MYVKAFLFLVFFSCWVVNIFGCVKRQGSGSALCTYSGNSIVCKEGNH